MKTLLKYVSTSDNFGWQILCKIRHGGYVAPKANLFKKCLTLSFIFTNGTSRSFINRFSTLLSVCQAFAQRLAEAMQRTLAPLRKIVTRELEVLAWHRTAEIPQSFIIHDHLECGHVQACLSWDIFDLLIAYTDNPQVRAKRHRCQPCAQLLATRKPMATVAIPAKAGVA